MGLDIPRVSQTQPISTTNTKKPDKTTNKSLKEHLSDSSWSGIARNWGLAFLFAWWGGQGIYDRNFNQKEYTTPQIKKLEDENTVLKKRIEKLENQLKDQRDSTKSKQIIISQHSAK